KKEGAEDDGAAGEQHLLRITSVPAGAEVLVDGASVGRTPYLGKGIDPNAPHAITLKKDGYENHEHMISASDWSRTGKGVQTVKLNVKLRKAGGAEPAKAEPGAGAKDKAAGEGEAAAKPKDEAPASE